METLTWSTYRALRKHVKTMTTSEFNAWLHKIDSVASQVKDVKNEIRWTDLADLAHSTEVDAFGQVLMKDAYEDFASLNWGTEGYGVWHTLCMLSEEIRRAVPRRFRASA